MKANFLIAFSIIVSLLLSIVSMPEWAVWARPEWPLMVLIYWTLAAPERCGILVAAIVGLFQDSLTAAVLGKHMLAYSLVIAVTLLAYQRLRMFDVWQQAIFVFLLLGLEQLIEYWIAIAFGEARVGLWFLVPAIMGAFLWPWLMVSLRGFRRKTGMVNRIG